MLFLTTAYKTSNFAMVFSFITTGPRRKILILHLMIYRLLCVKCERPEQRCCLIKQRKQRYCLPLILIAQFFFVYPRRETRLASFRSLSLSKPVQPHIIFRVKRVPSLFLHLFVWTLHACHRVFCLEQDLSAFLLDRGH